MTGSRVLALSLALALATWGIRGARDGRGAMGAISLLVIDDATDAAVPDVRVTVVGQVAEGVTNAAGRFFYEAPRAGRIAFVLRRIGYSPGALTVDVKAGDTARVTFAMTLAPHTLETVAVRDTMRSVSPTLSGFERRASVRAGSASYITRAEIDRAHATRVTDLLRRTASVTVEDSGSGVTVLARRASSVAKKCPLQIAVDGEIRYGYNLNMLVAEEIHGIEIYPGPATIPAEFATMRGTSACGMVMVWTRRDK